jgi:hypothetical protein
MHWTCRGNLQRKADVDVKATDEEFPGYMERNLE